MFNLKLSFLNIRRANHRSNILPMDFGAMYFLYPSENEHCVGFGSTGILDKLAGAVKTVFEKKDKTLEYYGTESFF
ncbi:MAG: hypothetical protein R2875_00290 [Desulfobacterales bacterium]|jgi:hypothetical protein